MSERVLETYALQILAPTDVEAMEGSAFSLEQRERRILADMPARLEEVEEDLADLLPEGFSVRIVKWDLVHGP